MFNVNLLEPTPCVDDCFATEYYEGVLGAIEKSSTDLGDANLEVLELLTNLHQTSALSYKKFSQAMYQLHSAGPDIKDIMIKAR